MSGVKEERRILYTAKDPEGTLLTCNEVITHHNDGRLTMYGAEYFHGSTLKHTVSGEWNRARANARISAHWEGFASNHQALVPCGKETVIETENAKGEKVTAVVKWIHPTAKARNASWGSLVASSRRTTEKDIRDVARKAGYTLIHSYECIGLLCADYGRVDDTCHGLFFEGGGPSTKAILSDIESSLFRATESCEAWYDLDARSFTREPFVADSREPFDTPDDPCLSVAYVTITVSDEE